MKRYCGESTLRRFIRQFHASLSLINRSREDHSCVHGKEPLRWIGPGETFESELDHFQKITSPDWVAGEKSVFGQAVNCLLEEILQSEQKEEETSM